MLSRQAVRQRSLTPSLRRSESYLNSQRAEHAHPLSGTGALYVGSNGRDSRHSLFRDYINQRCEMAMSSPCKDCQKRHLNCHSTCPGYLEYKKTREEIYKKRAEAYAVDPELKVYKRKRK